MTFLQIHCLVGFYFVDVLGKEKRKHHSTERWRVAPSELVLLRAAASLREGYQGFFAVLSVSDAFIIF